MKEFALQNPRMVGFLVFWLAIVVITATGAMWETWCNRYRPKNCKCKCNKE